MGLFYQKKNDFGEEDGRTAQFTDFLIAPNGPDLVQTTKEKESPNQQEEEVNEGKKEQQ